MALVPSSLGLGWGGIRHVRDTQRETSPRIATYRHVSPRSALSPFSARVSAPRTARQIATARRSGSAAAAQQEQPPSGAAREARGEQPTHARGARPGLLTHWPRAARVRKFAPFCESIFSHAARGARYSWKARIPTVRATVSVASGATSRPIATCRHVSPRSATHRHASPRIAKNRIRISV